MRRIETAEQRRHAPVNDSEMVDEMFGFIDSQVDGATEAGAPLAFKVLLLMLLFCLIFICFISFYLYHHHLRYRCRHPRHHHWFSLVLFIFGVARVRGWGQRLGGLGDGSPQWGPGMEPWWRVR